VSVIVVTNQSGIGRGLVTTEQLAAVAERMSALLAAEGARIDATYVCPHTEADSCECRKPGTLLYRRAARELDIDLSSAWFVGDRLRDVLPALALGGRGVLVPSAATPAAEHTDALARLGVAASLGEVVEHILGPLTAGRAQG
jgi:histidinol-phosphate phosphatase family protein